MKNRLLTPLVVVATAALAACSASEQDTGNNSNIATGLKLSGTVVDGYLARAVAYIDTNDNARLDTWEPWALTDKEGRISQASDGTNYCTSTVAEHEDYCLTGNLVKGSTVVVRVTGGYDSVTGEPFYGSMASTMTVGADGTVSGFTGTPLTTFVSTLSDDDAQNLANDLGVTVDELKGDFYALTDAAKRDKLTKAALKIHKTIDVMATTLKNANDAVSSLGDGEKPTDVSDKVYAALAAKWKAEKTANGLTTVDDILNNDTKLGEVLASAESEVKKAFGTESATYQAADNTKMTAVATQAKNLADTVDSVFNNSVANNGGNAGLDDKKLNAAMRAIEAVTIITRKDPSDSGSITNVTAAASSQTSLSDLETADEKTDVSLIASDSATSGTLPSFTNRPGLPALGGYKFSMADANDTNQKVEFYWGGTASATNGNLAICARHDQDGDGQYTNELFTGTWESLSTGGSWGAPDVSSIYSLLLNINAAGSTESLILKSVKMTLSAPGDTVAPVAITDAVNDPTNHDWVFAYDFNGELKEWRATVDEVNTSNPNATQYGAMPTTVDNCFPQ